MKRITFLTLLLAFCGSLCAQGPDTHYFGITDGKIYWQMDYDNPISQEDLAQALQEKGVLSQMDASKPGVITAKLPMHPVRFDGAGIRPEHAEILLTAAQVSGDVVIRLSGGHYHATVEHLVLQMARPSTQENISGTHPFEYHFKHHWGIIKNSMFNTYLGAALDYEFNNIFMLRKPGEETADKPSPSPFKAPSYSSKTTVSRAPSATTIAGRVLFPAEVTVYDLRSGEALEKGDIADVDGFYGQWDTQLFDSRQSISFVCFKPEAFQTQIVSAEREAADSTEALCRRYQAIAGINGSYFNMRERSSITYLKDEGTVIFPDNQAPQANGLVAVQGSGVRIVPTEGVDYAGEAVPEPDVMVSGPVLIQNGKMNSFTAETPDAQVFYMRRHPRSIIGKDDRGAIWLVAVDGRAEGKGEGMSITEAKAFAWKLGLVDALNLDGGGSTTLWVQPAGVINHPCDNHRFDPYGQRVIPNAILVQ